jgi:hypothetical protein
VTRADNRQKQRRPQVIAVAMLVLALVLRLPWTATTTPDPSRGFAAAFGEHALCIAAAGDATAPALPTSPGEHTDHDAAKCCQSHAAGEIILAFAGTTSFIAFATPADSFPEAAAPPASRSLARPQARGPPAA